MPRLREDLGERELHTCSAGWITLWVVADAPAEIEAAVLRVVEAAVGIDTGEPPVEVAARLLGFARAAETAMRQPIVHAISRLADRGSRNG